MEPINYEVLSQHSDATRDVGVAAQRLASTMARVPSWHGTGTSETTASDIAQPGGFRRFFQRQLGLADESSRPLVEDMLRVQREEDTLDARLASPLLPFYAGYLKGGVSEPSQLSLMILKAFTGAAVLYLPRSFLNGGLLLGAGTLAAVCFLFTVAMRLLIDCAERVLAYKTMASASSQAQYMDQGLPKLFLPSYGDIGEAALGRVGRLLVEVSLAASQLGFCSTYFLFVSANLSEVLGTLAGCRHVMSQRSLCLLLAAVWAPLALVRRLKHFSALNLVADACILLGLAVILAAAAQHFADHPPSWSVPLARMDSYPLCLGTAAFAFEGIGLVLPMYEGTEPALRKQFKGTLTWIMVGMCCFFIVFAGAAYLSFGPTTRTVILFNLQMGGQKRLASQILFCLALVCTYPLVLHPVSRLLEDRLLPGPGQDGGTAVQVYRDLLRAGLVLLTMLVALFSASRLQSLVVLVGGLCCAPLALAFPPVFHHLLVGGQWQLDLALSVLGLLLAVVSSTEAVLHWSTNQEIPYYSCSGS